MLAIAVAAAPLTPALATPDPDKSPYIVVDLDSGAVLSDREADQAWYPASLTKLMTAYVTFRAMAAGKVTSGTKVVQSAASAGQEPAKMGFEVGTKITLDNALKMMLVPSANDMAFAIAESVGGNVPAFVGMMNAEAARLGMTHTHFENPHGLPAKGQVSTAHDLALLARQIWTEFPNQRSLFGIQAISSGGTVYHSPNLALLERYKGAQGMATGFTCDAGYNIAAVATRSGRTILAVAFGRTSSDDRAEFTAQLLDVAFASKPAVTVTISSFAAPAVATAPQDMRLCAGSGVDRAGFGDTLLGPISVVRDPVPVVADRPSSDDKTASLSKGKPSAAAKGGGPAPVAKVVAAKGPAKVAPAPPAAVAVPIDLPEMPEKAKYRIIGSAEGQPNQGND